LIIAKLFRVKCHSPNYLKTWGLQVRKKGPVAFELPFTVNSPSLLKGLLERSEKKWQLQP